MVLSCKFIEYVRKASNRSLAGRPLGPGSERMVVVLVEAPGQRSVPIPAAFFGSLIEGEMDLNMWVRLLRTRQRSTIYAACASCRSTIRACGKSNPRRPSKLVRCIALSEVSGTALAERHARADRFAGENSAQDAFGRAGRDVRLFDAAAQRRNRRV